MGIDRRGGRTQPEIISACDTVGDQLRDAGEDGHSAGAAGTHDARDLRRAPEAAAHQHRVPLHRREIPTAPYKAAGLGPALLRPGW